jgi:crotonobetainyl-CoA:carnitine CoA-transferase CaiB-like acyl-CoA transferase
MLEGIRVIELGVWVAGPSAGGVLADWGADVVKIEAPAGDPMRRMLAVTVGHGRPESPPFDLDNRGKRSVVLDLTVPEGRAAALRLVERADVFLTNLRPEAVGRLGLGPDALLASNPGLVYSCVTGYGSSGPDAHRAGYDVGAFWARSGIAATAVSPDQPPPGIRGGLGDHVTGITTVAGIVGALFARTRTGRGQVVETSLLRTGIWCLGWDHSMQLRFGKLAPTSPRTSAMNAMVNTYRAADGRWFQLLGPEADRLWPKVCAALDRPDLATDERFATARDRRHNAVELITLLDELFAAHTYDEWVEKFDAHDAWFAPVLGPAEVVADPQAIASGAFVDIPGGAYSAEHRNVATPVDFGRDASAPRGPVPALGEHTDEVLTEADFGADEIAALRKAGALGS